MTGRGRGRAPRSRRAALVVVDLQEKLLPAIAERERVLKNSLLLLRLAQVLELPVVLTTQYRKGLGDDRPRGHAGRARIAPLDKVAFGCFGSAEFATRLAALGGRDQLLVAGIEAHICVAQTVLGALDQGCVVHVAADAVGSRTAENREIGLRRMEARGRRPHQRGDGDLRAARPQRRRRLQGDAPPPPRLICPCRAAISFAPWRAGCGIAVNTGGGDAPGLNAVLRAVTLTALNRGFEVFGIRKGYLGLLDTKYLVPLTSDTVRGITHLGGSILGTNNRGNPLAIRVVEDGRERYVDVSDQAVNELPQPGLRRPHRHRRRRLAEDRGRAGQEGHPHHRRAQDHRQRPRRHRSDLRLRDRGGHRHRRHRQAALHGREPRPRDGGRGHGPLLRLDRPLTPASPARPT